jgi:hypothetical protein
MKTFDFAQSFAREGLRASPLKWMAWTIASVAVLGCGTAVALRSDGIGRDTHSYRDHFLRLATTDDYVPRFELGYVSMMKVVAWMAGGNSQLFFAVVFWVVLGCMLLSAYLACRTVSSRDQFFFPVAAIGLLFGSSWFITGTTNGLRQGVALSVFYLGTSVYLFSRKRILGLAICLLSPLFHLSAVLIVPTVVLCGLLPLNLTIAAFAFTALLYAIGFPAPFWSEFSSITGIDVYGIVVEYAEGAVGWYGFQWDLFLYTIGWPAIYLVGRMFVRRQYRTQFDLGLKLYCLMAIPYFVLGFGNFSNRFALLAWAFLPILHCQWVSMAAVSVGLRWALTAVIFVAGITRFGLYLAG